MRVAIIGAGISGLALAYYLQKLGVRYDLFEGEAHVGGLIRTETKGPYLLELGPTSLPLSPDVQELLGELKLEDQVITATGENQDIFIRRGGQFQGVAPSLRKLLLNPFSQGHATSGFSPKENPSPPGFPNETVSQFFTRCLGQDVADYVVQPLVTTLYGGDPEKLLLGENVSFPKGAGARTWYPSERAGRGPGAVRAHVHPGPRPAGPAPGHCLQTGVFARGP